MIITLLLYIVGGLLNGIFYFLPVVSLSDLPLVGSVISNFLISAVSVWNSFMITFPYASTLWSVFLQVIIPFELLVLVSKFFLGSRNLAHHE